MKHFDTISKTLLLLSTIVSAACGGAAGLTIAQSERGACSDLGTADTTLDIGPPTYMAYASSNPNTACGRIVADVINGIPGEMSAHLKDALTASSCQNTTLTATIDLEGQSNEGYGTSWFSATKSWNAAIGSDGDCDAFVQFDATDLKNLANALTAQNAHAISNYRIAASATTSETTIVDGHIIDGKVHDPVIVEAHP
jgi:hypothetical protein